MSDDDKSREELELELRLLRRRVSALEAARSAFVPWPVPALAPGRPSATDARELLRVVTQRPRRNVTQLAQVPASYLSVSQVTSRLVRPRSLDARHARAEWYPQLETAFLLHLPGGFLGDNAVFDADRYYSFGRWWLLPGPELYSGVDEIRRIDAGISIAAWGGEAFQHFVTDALPRLAAVIDLLERPELAHVQIVSHAEGAPMARWFWDALGLSDRVVQKPRRASEGFVLHANHVLYLDFDPNLGVEGVYPRDVLRPLQLRLGLLEPARRDRILYLTRDDMPERRVMNEAGLLSRIDRLLAESPYRLEIFRHRGDLQGDIERMRRAKVVVGPHGGAFANLVFAQPGTHVVEFLPIYDLPRSGDRARPLYWGLAQAAGLDYWTVTPKVFGFEGRDLAVDPEEVVAVLRHVLASDPPR